MTSTHSPSHRRTPGRRSVRSPAGRTVSRLSASPPSSIRQAPSATGCTPVSAQSWAGPTVPHSTAAASTDAKAPMTTPSTTLRSWRSYRGAAGQTYWPKP